MTAALPQQEPREWPPVYDEADLDATISDVRKKLPKHFYVSSIDDPEPCQGDVLELQSAVPVIDADGDAVGIGDNQFWIVVANTCDVARLGDTDKVEFAPIAPLIALSAIGFDAIEEQAARAYMLSRIFYVPEWDASGEPHIADLTRMVPMHRDALRGKAVIRARMERRPWVLLNACLVRLLCRADGRHT